MIVPSIVAKDTLDLEYKLKQLGGSIARWVHIDVVDGEFATPACWPYTADDIDEAIHSVSDLPKDISIGVHLMVKDPQENLDEWIDTPVKRILVQYESPEHLQNALAVLDMSKIESGVVLALSTPVEVISELPEKIKFVQLMAISKIGHYGEKLQDEIFEKVKKARELYPGVTISVDGGVKEEHLIKLAKAGADQVVMGSAIFEAGNPATELERLQSLLK